jgi:hypothetical protein
LKLSTCFVKSLATRIKSQLVALLLLVVAVNANAGDSVETKLSLANAWVKKPMPGMMMTAGFVEITNLSDQSVVLIDVRTPVSKVAELHAMKMVDGVMKMRFAEQGWHIAVGETLALAPGGKHAMLMGLQKPLQIQQQVLLEFKFEGLGWMSVNAQVR